MSSSFGSVIVEPRKHPAFEFVVKNVLSMTPIGSPMVIVHGTTNGSWIQEKLQNGLPAEEYSRISFYSCGKSNLTGKEYNQLLKTASFWTRLPFSKILVFQTDSIILSKDRNEILRYLPYVYVGAPWKSGKVGNGGFSLRDKAYCLDVIRHKKQDPQNINEDVYFSSFMYNQNNKYVVTPTSTAQSFAIETTFYPNPFAVHNCWKYLSSQQWSQLCHAYPELVQLRQLQITTQPVRARVGARVGARPRASHPKIAVKPRRLVKRNSQSVKKR
jgi:hypothetical protein